MIDKKARAAFICGKFDPLHIGHQWLISQAIQHVEEVILFVWPSKDGLGQQAKIRLIERLYPFRVTGYIVPDNAPSEIGITSPILAQYRLFFRYFMRKYCRWLKPREIILVGADSYIEPTADACGFQSLVLDRQFNVSSSMLRKHMDPEYMTRLVYNEYRKVAILVGAPGSGKTTVSEKYYEMLYGPGPADGRLVTERSGIDVWNKNQQHGRLTTNELGEILSNHDSHIRHAVETAPMGDTVIVDTCAITTFIYYMYYGYKLTVDMDAYLRKQILDYPVNRKLFLCMPDFKYDDNTHNRSGPGQRNLIHRLTVNFLKKYGIPYTPLEGGVNERVETIAKTLGA